MSRLSPRTRINSTPNAESGGRRVALTQINAGRSATGYRLVLTDGRRTGGCTMPSFSPKMRRQLRFAAFLVVVLVAYEAAAQSPPPVVNGPPIPAGQGRVWFYRVFFPEDTGGMPPVSMNGQLVGYARAGWSFYRDMPAGAYHVTVESYLPSSGWSKDIVLLPGTQVALAIEFRPYLHLEPKRVSSRHLQRHRRAGWRGLPACRADAVRHRLLTRCPGGLIKYW